LAVVVAKCLFIDIPEQVEGADTNVGAMQTTLQETPEVLNRVGVDIAVHILHGVVDDGVLILVFKPVVRLQFISEDRGSGFDVLADLLLQFRLAAVINDHCPHIPVTFNHAEDYGLILSTRASDDALPFRLVHVSGLAADESFINLDLATEFIESALLHRKTNAMEHKPRGFLSDSKTSMNFIATDTILATDDQPRGGKPLLKRNRRIFKDSASLQRESRACVFRIALPDAILSEVTDVVRPALRALHDAISPPQRNHKLAAMLEVRKPDNRISEGVWRFHVLSMRWISWNVKYVIANENS
jgi:hypothetical protein